MIDSEPVLGYMSLGQIREFALGTDENGSQRATKILATSLFYKTLRSFGDTYAYFPGEREMYFDDEHGEMEIALRTDSKELGTLINMDTFQYLLDSGKLIEPRTKAQGCKISPAIGEKALALAQDYTAERAQFLLGQQGQSVVQ